MTACKCFEDQCSYVYCNFRLWMDDRIEDVCEVANSIIGCQFKWGQHLNGLGIVEWGFTSVFEEDKVEFVYLCKGRMKVKLTTLCLSLNAYANINAIFAWPFRTYQNMQEPNTLLTSNTYATVRCLAQIANLMTP